MVRSMIFMLVGLVSAVSTAQEKQSITISFSEDRCQERWYDVEDDVGFLSPNWAFQFIDIVLSAENVQIRQPAKCYRRCWRKKRYSVVMDGDYSASRFHSVRFAFDENGVDCDVYANFNECEREIFRSEIANGAKGMEVFVGNMRFHPSPEK